MLTGDEPHGDKQHRNTPKPTFCFLTPQKTKNTTFVPSTDALFLFMILEEALLD